MELCFLARLEPTGMRWENGHVSMTSLQRKQVCKSATVSSLCVIKHFPSAPMLTVTLTVANTKLCIQIFHPALMGDPTNTTRGLANALHCGVSVTDLHAHVIFSAKSRPSTARVPVLLCSFSKIFGADAQIFANVIVVIHDDL